MPCCGSSGSCDVDREASRCSPSPSSPEPRCAADLQWRWAAGGGEHAVFVDAAGRLFTCGSDENGRRGAGTPEALAPPALLQVDTDGDSVELVAAGEYHTLFSTKRGRVFAFGCGSVGQLGLNSSADEALPREVIFFRAVGKRVRALAAGETSSFVVLEDGSAHSFGLDETGCLGVASTMVRAGPSTKHTERYGFGARGVRSRSIPQHITALAREEIVGVAAGASHTLFCVAGGAVFACGTNADRQLGLGPDVRRSSIPRRVPLPDGVRAIAVACGAQHSVVLSADGRVVVFGTNTEGALGAGPSVERVPAPAFVGDVEEKEAAVNDHRAQLPPIGSVACGAAHTVLLTESRDALFVAGWNVSGQLGLGPDVAGSLRSGSSGSDSVWKFTRVSIAAACGGANPRVRHLACGTHTTHIVLDDGRAFSCGCGGRGQLGDGGTAVRSARFVRVRSDAAALVRFPVLHLDKECVDGDAKGKETEVAAPLDGAAVTRSHVDAKALRPTTICATASASAVDPRHRELHEYARRLAAEAAGVVDADEVGSTASATAAARAALPPSPSPPLRVEGTKKEEGPTRGSTAAQQQPAWTGRTRFDAAMDASLDGSLSPPSSPSGATTHSDQLTATHSFGVLGACGSLALSADALTNTPPLPPSLLGPSRMASTSCVSETESPPHWE